MGRGSRGTPTYVPFCSPGCAWWMITSVARQSLALEVHCLRKCGGGYRHTPLLRSKQHSSSVSPPECPAADASAGRDPIGEVRTPTPRESVLHALPDAAFTPHALWMAHSWTPARRGWASQRTRRGVSCRHLGVLTLMGECATGVRAMTRSAGLKVQDSSGGRALLSLSQPSISSTAQRPQHPMHNHLSPIQRQA